LEAALALQQCSSLQACAAGEAAIDEAARQLLAAARAYVPVSHLLWGLWGLIQVCNRLQWPVSLAGITCAKLALPAAC
jgi:hypothetical protein